MKPYQVVFDTNVIVTAFRSRLGASYKLLSLVGSDKFEINLSVPLVFEYEDATKRFIDRIPLDEKDIDDIIDYLCAVAHSKEVYFLWRPFLKDPKDDMVLELAVTANCDYIVTYNQRDYEGIEQFGIRAITPRDFLELIGELS
jgi:putative PIN family toxin of toxin-antitoxin system